MNTNEISRNPNVPFKQIKKGSRVLMFLFLCYLVIFGCGGMVFSGIVWKTPTNGYWRVFGRTYERFSDVPFVNKLIAMVAIGFFLTAIVTVYQLLNLYQKGILFSGRNVRLLGRLGWLVCGYGAIVGCFPTLLFFWDNWINSSAFLGKATLFGIISILISPWVMGGLFLIVISRIMDVGRKIQEEQELTV